MGIKSKFGQGLPKIQNNYISPADIGYGYGYLLADEIEAAYWSLMESLLGDKFYDKVGYSIVVCA